MERSDRRTILGSLGALLAVAALLFKGGAGRSWARPGAGRPEGKPRPRIAPPEGSVKRHG